MPQTDKCSKQDGKDGQQVEDGDAPEADYSDYIAHVAFDRTAISVDGHQQSVTPATAVTTEIKTGQRRVIDFVLSPLARHVTGVGEER